MKSSFLIVVTSFLLLSCQTAPPKKPLDSNYSNHPNWYLNPPADSQDSLYGIGSGESQALALKDALAYLASKLTVSVSSTTSVNKTLYQGAYEFKETELEKNTTTQVKQVEINQFSQLKMQQIGYQNYIVLIKSNKQQLAEDYQRQLEQAIKHFQQDNDMLTSKAGYRKYLQARQHALKLNRFIDRLSIYQSLSHQKNIQTYQQHIAEVTQYLKQQQTNTHFNIKATNGYQKVLSNQLSKQGFKNTQPLISNTTTNTIKIIEKSKTTQAEGFYIIRSQLDINLYEHNKRISSNTVNLKGQGLNEQQAEANQQSKLSQLIKQNGLNNFLGLKVN